MKHHNSLSDSQIHNAKGFEPARKRSVSTKNLSGVVEWVNGNYTSTITITPVADQAGSLHHQFICINSSYDAVKYAVYFQVSSSAILSTPSGYTGVIAVDLTASGINSTLLQVGTALQTTLNSHADFTATINGEGLVTVTGLTSASPAKPNSSAFIISVVDVEISDEVLTTDASGNLKFTSLASVAADKNYIHTQSSAAEVWVVTHNLAKNCSVTVIDSAGTVVIGQVDYNSINQITLTFKASFSGKAYFN
jgi:hypothetical protein|tara:strand:+ start:855 stop:1607 length:753 start_codon:yes stop_codon:yes gene_type:complete